MLYAMCISKLYTYIYISIKANTMKDFNKSCRKRIMQIAWRIFWEADHQCRDTGKGFKTFGESLSLAWKIVKEWNGSLNEAVTIFYNEVITDLNNNQRIQEKQLTVVIR